MITPEGVNKISKEVTSDYDVDFSKAVVASINRNEASEHTFNDVSVAIASAVTS